jgi:hypothetical protein
MNHGQAGQLARGCVISYSASTSGLKPYGFRRVVERDLFTPVARRWPDLSALLAVGTPLVINGYPATIGTYPAAAFVDTYLNRRTFIRALRLAVAERALPIVISQPLIAADFLFEHMRGEYELPRELILALGGYVLPESLERAITTSLRRHGCTVTVLQFYGMAEVDSAIFMARSRDGQGTPEYYLATPDVKVKSDTNNRMYLARDTGVELTSWHDTGDQVRLAGETYFITPSTERASEEVLQELESWTNGDWERRTGFIHYSGGHLQLRRGCHSREPREVPFWRYAESYGFDWTLKPRWTRD